MIECLLEADPSSATSLNGDGDTVLHILCDNICSSSASLVRLCLKTAPELASTRGQFGRLPIHVVSNPSFQFIREPTEVISVLLNAYKEGARVADDEGSLPLHHAAYGMTLASVKILVEAHPAALSVCTDRYGSPFSQASGRKDSEGLAVLKYLYELQPDSIMEFGERKWLPLHFAASFASLDIMNFLLSKYSEAAKAQTSLAGSLPLHLLIERFQSDSLSTKFGDMLRVLLRYYPDAAEKPDSDGVIPYSMAVEGAMPFLIRRLLLRAVPVIDPAELRRLNYEERRMAMFLAYSAVPQSITNSFVVRLRRLTNKDHSLLRLIVSFL
jgi:ankyrin repeat protein